MKFRLSTLSRYVAILSIAMLFASPLSVQAAFLTSASDQIDTPTTSSASNHTVSFVTPTGIDAPTDTITVSLPSFTLTTIVAGDVGLTYGPTGTETIATVGGSAAVGVWGVSVGGTTLTLAPPTDAVPGLVAAGNTVRVTIGTNTSGGTHQITNPSSAGRYQISIAGGFGDTGAIGVSTIDSNVVSVTANYPPPIVVTPPPTTGGDTTPPTISNIQASSTSFTSEIITWTTDESANAAVEYGQPGVASGTVSNSSLLTSHSITLTGLIACQTYIFDVVSSDATGNLSRSARMNFQTPCVTVPPVLSNIRVENILDTSAIVLWSTNVPATSIVEYGITTAYGSTSTDGGLVTNHSAPIAGLQSGTTYHFRVISTDGYGNTAISGDMTFTTTSDTTPPTNVSLTATPGNTIVTLTWTSPIEPDATGVRIVRRTDRAPTGPNDGTIVYDGNGTSYIDAGLTNGVTYYYGAFAYDASGNYSSGSIAFATPSEELPPENPPTSTPPIPPTTSTPPTNSSTSTPPTGPTTTSTIPISPQTATSGTTITVLFYGAGGRLPLSEGGEGVIGVRGNASITAMVPIASMNGQASAVMLFVGSFAFRLEFDPALNAYTGTFSVSPGQSVHVKAQAVFTDKRIANIDTVLTAHGVGLVVERPLVGMGHVPVSGAEVRLYREQLGAWVEWNGASYGETNPQITGGLGQYIFEVPPGKYYAEVSKVGFETRKTDPLFVDSNIFNPEIELIRLPSPFPIQQGNIVQNTGRFFQNIAQNVGYGIKKFQEWLDKNGVQKANEDIFAPSILTLAIVNAAPAVSSLMQLFALLQYFFTQPILLLRRRRKRCYGVVYNSLTKLPVDLAIVRLIDGEFNRTIQTCVTDKQGRYFFRVQNGTYRIEVVKPKYSYPSEFSKGKKNDAGYEDLHTGEDIILKQDAVLSLNIPIDPTEYVPTSKRIRLVNVGRRVQSGIALFGVLVSVLIVLVSPTVPMALFALMQIAIYRMFKRLAIPLHSKSWGEVIDHETGEPVISAVVRLYDAETKQLIDSHVTDRRGTYGFLAGKSVYNITAEAPGYDKETVHDIDLTHATELVVREKITLKRPDRKLSTF